MLRHASKARRSLLFHKISSKTILLHPKTILRSADLALGFYCKSNSTEHKYSSHHHGNHNTSAPIGSSLDAIASRLSFYRGGERKEWTHQLIHFRSPYSYYRVRLLKEITDTICASESYLSQCPSCFYLPIIQQ
jgi:hypothetical protein